jgi:hypothetical protein
MRSGKFERCRSPSGIDVHIIRVVKSLKVRARASSAGLISVRAHEVSFLGYSSVMQVRLHLRFKTSPTVRRKLRDGDCRQNTDDRYDNQQLDEGKTPFSFQS